MAEIDDKSPFESVHDVISLFEQKIQQQKYREKEKELDLLMKDLAACKLQLEIKESACMEAALKLEVYHKALVNLSSQLKHSEADRDKYIEQYRKSQVFLSMLGSEYEAVIDKLIVSIKNNEELLHTLDEFKHMKEEIFQLKVELSVAEESKVSALAKAELAEQAVKDMTVHSGMMNDLANELLEKTMLADYYQLELMQAKETLTAEMEVMQTAVFDERNYTKSIEAEVKRLEEELQSTKEKVSDLKGQVEALVSEIHEDETSELEIGLFVTISAEEYDSLIRKAKIVDDRITVLEFKDVSGNQSEIEVLKDELQAANAEISDLRFALEDATRRSELAENAKLAIEEQLRKWRMNQQQRRTNSAVRLRPRAASLQDEKLVNYIPLGKLLNMNY